MCMSSDLEHLFPFFVKTLTPKVRFERQRETRIFRDNTLRQRDTRTTRSISRKECYFLLQRQRLFDSSFSHARWYF